VSAVLAHRPARFADEPVRSNNSANQSLRPLGWSSERIKQTLNDPSVLLLSTSPSDAADLRDLREAYRTGFQRNFWLLAALTACAFGVTFVLMPQRSVDRKDDQELRDKAKLELEEKKERKRAKRAGGAETPAHHTTSTSDEPASLHELHEHDRSSSADSDHHHAELEKALHAAEANAALAPEVGLPPPELDEKGSEDRKSTDVP